MKTRFYLVTIALLATIALAGSAEAQTEAPGGWNRYAIGGTHHTPFVEADNNTSLIAARGGNDALNAYNSTDGGVTWTNHTIMASPPGIGINNPINVKHKDGRTVVSYRGTGDAYHVMYSQDLDNWTYVNDTHPLTNDFGDAFFMVSQDEWYYTTVFWNCSGCTNQIRTVIRHTADAGDSWATTDTTTHFTGQVTAKAFGVLYGNEASDILVGMVKGDGASTFTSTACYTANTGSSWACANLHGSNNIERSLELGETDGVFYAVSGEQEGTEHTEIFQKPCLEATCGGWLKVGTLPNNKTIDGGGSFWGIAGNAKPDNPSIFTVGWPRNTVSTAEDLHFQFLVTNNSLAVDDDLTDLTTNGDLCFADVLADGTPAFTCNGYYYKGFAGFFPVAHDQTANVDSAVSVKTDWDTSTNHLVYSYDSTNQVTRQSASDLVTVQTHDICSGVTGAIARSVVKGNIYVAPNGNIWTACKHPTESNIVLVHAPVGLTVAPVAPENFQFSGTSGFTVCEMVIITNDIGSVLNCNNDIGYLIDPGLSSSDGLSEVYQAVTGTLIPQPWMPDYGPGITSNDEWAFVGSIDDVLWSVTNSDEGTGQGTFRSFSDFEYNVGTVCGRTIFTQADPGGLISRAEWFDGYDEPSTSAAVNEANLLFNRMIPSKDCQYLYASTSTRIYVIDATTLEVLARTLTTEEVDPALGLRVWTDFDVDAANNYIYTAINTTDGVLQDRIYRFPIHDFTASLTGNGTEGSPNPSVMDPFWEGYDSLEDVTGTEDPRAETSTGTGTGDTPSVGGGSGTIFGDVTALDDSFGTSGSGAFFIGILLVLLLTAGIYIETRSTPLALVAGLLGFGFAVFLGFIPAWVPIFGAFLAAAVIVNRRVS